MLFPEAEVEPTEHRKTAVGNTTAKGWPRAPCPSPLLSSQYQEKSKKHSKLPDAIPEVNPVAVKEKGSGADGVGGCCK